MVRVEVPSGLLVLQTYLLTALNDLSTLARQLWRLADNRPVGVDIRAGLHTRHTLLTGSGTVLDIVGV